MLIGSICSLMWKYQLQYIDKLQNGRCTTKKEHKRSVGETLENCVVNPEKSSYVTLRLGY
jgi:hypothetical protein